MARKELLAAVRLGIETRIQDDGERAPDNLKPLFPVLARRIFDSKLTVKNALSEAKIRDKSVGEPFKTVTGETIRDYIAEARVEAAEALIKSSELKLAKISETVGFFTYDTFAKTFRRRRNVRPSEVEQHGQRETSIPLDDAVLVVQGLLEEEKAEWCIRQLLRLYPTVAEKLAAEAIATVARSSRRIIDGARTDKLEVEELWREIRDLPFEAQQQVLAGIECRSKALFDYLRRTSRIEGRKDRQRGVKIAELALLCLEPAAESFGPEIHDLRALGYAWLGNAHRLALDFSAAAEAFEAAEHAWSQPRPREDRAVLAALCALKGCLLLVRREYDAAFRLVDRSCNLYRDLGCRRAEARELILRSRIHIFADRLREAVEDLREAECLIEVDTDRELAFAIQGNLATALVRGGEAELASTVLNKAWTLCNEEDPLGKPNLVWIDGLISERLGDLERAESLYQEACAAFRAAKERKLHCLVAVDLMVVYANKEEWSKVESVAVETIPILSEMELHEETIATAKLVEKATKAGSSTAGSAYLLMKLQGALRHDPLVT